MSETSPRRALLRLFGTAPVLAILPAGSALALASTASPVHPDAALFAMQHAIDAADELLEAALDALKPAEEAYFEKDPDGPAQPEPDFLAEERQALDLLGAAAALRAIKGPSPAWAAYYGAVANHEREVKRLHAQCGVTAAQEMEESRPRGGVMSDLFDDAPELVSALKHFRHKKHEVLVFQTLDRAELTFPFDDVTRIEDLETHREVTSDPRALRKAYLEELGTFLDAVRQGCLDAQDRIRPGGHQSAFCNGATYSCNVF